MVTHRLKSLYKWHSIIRDLDLDGTHPKVIANILRNAGCEQTENSIRRYANRWRDKGWRTAEELGITHEQKGLEVLENLKKKKLRPIPVSTGSRPRPETHPSDSKEMDSILETAPDPFDDVEQH